MRMCLGNNYKNDVCLSLQAARTELVALQAAKEALQASAASAAATAASTAAAAGADAGDPAQEEAPASAKTAHRVKRRAKRQFVRRSASCGDLSAAVAAVKAGRPDPALSPSPPCIPEGLEVPAALPAPEAGLTAGSISGSERVGHGAGADGHSPFVAAAGHQSQGGSSGPAGSPPTVGGSPAPALLQPNPWSWPCTAARPSTAPPAAHAQLGDAAEMVAEVTALLQQQTEGPAAGSQDAAGADVAAAAGATGGCPACVLTRVQAVAAEEAFAGVAAKLLNVERQLAQVRAPACLTACVRT